MLMFPKVQIVLLFADIWFRSVEKNLPDGEKEVEIPSSDSEDSMVTLRTMPFSPGQVYYASIAQQVHVLSADAGD